MSIMITPESPDSPDARALIAELEATLEPHYPSESRHGYSVQQLLDQSVLFYVIRQAGDAAGCGGIQLFGTDYAEIKRMYVRPRYRGRGLARRMLELLADMAVEKGVSVLRLETGIYQTAAITLYERAGFRRIPPFGSYRDDPLSVFFEKALT